MLLSLLLLSVLVAEAALAVVETDSGAAALATTRVASLSNSLITAIFTIGCRLGQDLSDGRRARIDSGAAVRVPWAVDKLTGDAATAGSSGWRAGNAEPRQRKVSLFTSNAFIPLQLFARLTPSGPAGKKMRRGEKLRRRMAGWERMEEDGRGWDGSMSGDGVTAEAECRWSGRGQGTDRGRATTRMGECEWAGGKEGKRGMGRGRAGGRTASRDWPVGEGKSASGAPECPAKQHTEGP